MKNGLAAAAVALVFATPAFALTDEEFLTQAMEIDLAEISMGQLAQQQGGSEAVKEYGRRLVTDHIANGAQVIALTTSMGLAPATQPPAGDMAIHRQLMTMNGADFDRAFATRMIEGHREAIELFEDKAAEGGDVGGYAESTLPTLEGHLQLARQLLETEREATNGAPAADDEQAATAVEQPPATVIPDAATRDQMQLAVPDTISADSLAGVSVYSADNEKIGEISDVLLSNDTDGGAIDAVIIDVGGFLGIGAKPVAVGFDTLEIRADEDGTLHAYSSYRQAQLEAAPEYDADAYAQNRDTMRLSPTR